MSRDVVFLSEVIRMSTCEPSAICQRDPRHKRKLTNSALFKTSTKATYQRPQLLGRDVYMGRLGVPPIVDVVQSYADCTAVRYQAELFCS